MGVYLKIWFKLAEVARFEPLLAIRNYFKKAIVTCGCSERLKII
jgi:hypothetical protein